MRGEGIRENLGKICHVMFCERVKRNASCEKQKLYKTTRLSGKKRFNEGFL